MAFELMVLSDFDATFETARSRRIRKLTSIQLPTDFLSRPKLCHLAKQPRSAEAHTMNGTSSRC